MSGFCQSMVLNGVDGIWVCDPVAKTIVRRKGVPIHFNQDGRANCLWRQGFPYFAPCADYGLEDGAAVADVGDELKASHWDKGSIGLYLEKFHPDYLPVLETLK